MISFLTRRGCANLAALALTSCLAAAAPPYRVTQEKVGHATGTNRLVTPVNQVVTPLGRQLDLPGLRPQVLALSPDGKLLATAGKTSELIIVDPASGEILQKVALPNDGQNEPHPDVASSNILKPDTKGLLSFTGLIFSPDGRRIYFSNVNGSIKVFAVAADGKVSPSHSIPLPLAHAPRRKEEIPTGLAINADGSRLLVCGNLSNQLFEIDTASGKVLRTFPVGVAPLEVLLAGDRAYVSNWGGRRPEPGDLTGPAGRGTVVRIDPVHHVASEGSVSIIDLGASCASTPIREVLTQLHASALALSPDGRYLVCANAASDNLSVLDTRAEKVVETIWVKPSPAEIFGASPNALAFDAAGKTLYVANGTQNAIAVVRFKPSSRSSKLLGLVPVGWFPGAVLFDGRRGQLIVANIKGHAFVPKKNNETGASGFNSHQYTGSLSFLPIPRTRQLGALSARVWENYRREQLSTSLLKPRPNQAPRAVPERIGEPSLIKHVVYVIKENRTYDQVMGDIAKGNGDPSLCIFGAGITPNQHKMVNEFVLLDNTYCCGILSADGHQWSTTAFGTDYLERSFAGWPRSYPDGMGDDEADALAYAPTGFLWDNARLHGRTLWNFGEFAAPLCRWADPKKKGEPAWKDFYDEFLHGQGHVIIESRPCVDTMKPFTPTSYVGWEMTLPDVWRARHITNQIAAWTRAGQMPNLVLICLPNDHTSGTSRGHPTPAAYAADNDLAFGQIVEALSHSPFWKEMAIFGIEDDPQAGWDHVSGYRTTAYCVSPYAKRGEVVSVQYNTTSLIRTMEQILGLPPMNQFDATATPMFACFTDQPDFRPFNSVPNLVPLDQMNPDPRAMVDPELRRDALRSARMNFRQVDKAPEDALNRILWRAMKGSQVPYPEWAVARVEDDDD